MPDLRSSIQSLAQTFAAGALEAIRSSSLEDMLVVRYLVMGAHGA
jgi:hypothetical protein